jgi:hypothetical protein
MKAITLVTIHIGDDEVITLNETEVIWFGKGGQIVGHCTTEEFRDFCKDFLADIKHQESDDL